LARFGKKFITEKTAKRLPSAPGLNVLKIKADARPQGTNHKGDFGG
jgi:hypothetical protein